MYDETYGVIYEEIASKLRASLEPFWDLKISKYVEYLMRVSSEYITSWVLLFSVKHCWLNFTCFLGLRNAVDSLALYIIAHIIVTRAGPRETAAAWPSLKGILCRRVRLCDWSIETCPYQGWESILDAISMISGAASINVYAFYWRPFVSEATIVFRPPLGKNPV